MKGIVLFFLSIIAITLSNAYGRKKPHFDVFEIRENQRTRELQVNPVKLQYDLESQDKEEEYKMMINRLLKPMKKNRSKDLAGNIVKRLQVLKEQDKAAKAKDRAYRKKTPIIVLVSPDSLYGSGNRKDKDATRSKDLLKVGSNVQFNIVSPNPLKRGPRSKKIRSFLRNVQRDVNDRTDSPRTEDRIYYVDMDLDEDKKIL